MTEQDKSQATPELQRRRRATVGGHAMQLDAEQRPGFVRRFVNATPKRLQEMQELGYSIVTGAESEGKRRTQGLGSNIARHAGVDQQGQPYQTILMETPDKLFAQGEAEKEDGRKAFEETIRRGMKTEDTPEGAYIPSPNTITHRG